MVKLRLKRLGRTHLPYYRLSAMESRNQRDGRTLEELGTYDPTNKDAAKQITLKIDRIEHWLQHGAQPTETVRNLLRKNGVKVK